MLGIRSEYSSMEVLSDIASSGEIVACKVRIRALTLIVVCIYIPPGNSFKLQRLEEVLQP